MILFRPGQGYRYRDVLGAIFFPFATIVLARELLHIRVDAVAV